MKIAIVHDYLNQAGGAERVVGSLHRIFPDAPIYTTIADPAVVEALLPGADVRTSWMQRLPGLARHSRKYFLLYPMAIEHFDLSEYDLVISSSSAYAKSAIVRPGACHVCYCNTPMRFAWNFEEYSARESWGPLTRWLLPPFIAWLRRWDLRTAHRPTAFIANSSTIAARIGRHYGRPSRVVHPPIELKRFAPRDVDGDYHLVVSRLMGYKRIDLAVEAFTRMGKRLVVLGDGPARKDLERAAGPAIQFLGRVSDEEVAFHYARCRALIFPGEEDLGLTPLEANASGRPVIAYRAGGALDTVAEGVTGVFFDSQTPDALIGAVEECQRRNWDKAVLRRHAEQFSEEVFRDRLLDVVRGALELSGQNLDHDGTVGDRDRQRRDVLYLPNRLNGVERRDDSNLARSG